MIFVLILFSTCSVHAMYVYIISLCIYHLYYHQLIEINLYPYQAKTLLMHLMAPEGDEGKCSPTSIYSTCVWYPRPSSWYSDKKGPSVHVATDLWYLSECFTATTCTRRSPTLLRAEPCLACSSPDQTAGHLQTPAATDTAVIWGNWLAWTADWHWDVFTLCAHLYTALSSGMNCCDHDIYHCGLYPVLYSTLVYSTVFYLLLYFTVLYSTVRSCTLQNSTLVQ